MELSKDITNSLILSNNINNLTDDGFRKLLDNSFAALLNKPDIHNLSSINPSKADIIKEIYAALMTFILEITRHNHSLETTGTFLSDEIGISQNRRDLFLKMYDKQKSRLINALSMIGNHPPHIIDVNWKMDYIIKTSSCDESLGPIYRIQLSTEVYDENISQKKIEHVNFSCNTQQLQDLVYKLKDAVRHCEKLSLEN